MRLLHVKSPMMQYNACLPKSRYQSGRRQEYYPYGLQTANSYTRDNAKNNFLYNAGTEMNTTSGMYDLFFRNYDPALGRMNGVDPKAGKYAGLSPYNYSFNDPVYWNDPLGDDATSTYEKKFGSGGGGDYYDAHAGMYGSSFDFSIADAMNASADGAFANLSGGFSGAWNLATYGSYSGAGGATSLGGFGAGYSGTWEKYVSGYQLVPAASRRPRYEPGGRPNQRYTIEPVYGYRFVPSKSDRVGRGPSIGGEGQQQQQNNGGRPDPIDIFNPDQAAVLNGLLSHLYYMGHNPNEQHNLRDIVKSFNEPVSFWRGWIPGSGASNSQGGTAKIFGSPVQWFVGVAGNPNTDKWRTSPGNMNLEMNAQGFDGRTNFLTGQQATIYQINVWGGSGNDQLLYINFLDKNAWNKTYTYLKGY